MKTFLILAVVVACVNARYKVADIKKLIPSFTSDFVIKGHEATPNSAPFIVSLSQSDVNHKHFCGGTIVDKEWVITAAHCIPKREPKGISVVAGLHHQSEIDNKTQQSLVDWGLVHEDFGNGVGPYDIALLHMATPFKFNKYVKPAILPANEESHTGDIRLYGWGQPKFYAVWGSKSLQTVATQIMPYEECKAALPEDAPLHPTNICSDSLKQSISACNGDSGGPLVIEDEDLAAELVGVVSWGYIPCGVKRLPSVYTRVSAYRSWITKTQNDFYTMKKQF